MLFLSNSIISIQITEYNKQNAKKQSTGSQSDREAANFPNQTRNKILAALFAAIAMTGYAVANGMFQVCNFYVNNDYLICNY